MSAGIYLSLYNLLHQYIYGSAQLTEHMDLTITILATAGAIFLVSLPFVLVWRVLKLFA